MTNDVWKMRERQRRTNCALQRYTGYSSAEEYSFLSILVAFVPFQSKPIARATLRTPPPVQTWACTSRTHVVCICVGVCVWKGREEGIFTDNSIYIGFSTHLRVVYNVLCTIKTRTQQRACNKKEGEERTIEREGKGNYIERNENREIKKKEKRKERRSETERYRLLGKGIEEKITLEGKYIRDKRERKMLVCQVRAERECRIQNVLSYFDDFIDFVNVIICYYITQWRKMFCRETRIDRIIDKL